MRLTDIVTRLGCSAEGEPEVEITGVAGVEEASHTELTFLSNPKYARKLRNTIVSVQAEGPMKQAAVHEREPALSMARVLASLGAVNAGALQRYTSRGSTIKSMTSAGSVR